MEVLREAVSNKPEQVKGEFPQFVIGKLKELREQFLRGRQDVYHWETAARLLPELRPLVEAIKEFRHNNAALFEQYYNNFPEALNLPEKGLEHWFNEIVLLSAEEWIDLTSPWPKLKYKDLVREKVSNKTDGKISDWFALSSDERRRVAIEDLKLAGEIGKEYEDFEVTGAVFEKLVEPTLTKKPTFVTHLPKELVPLAKLSPDDPTTVEVFECCINGQEISPGYTEQNDPIAQRATLEHQAGGEQQKLDEDFLVALEHGMPPAGGIGIGIDRLCMMLLGQESIRDVILFPQLKPK